MSGARAGHRATHALNLRVGDWVEVKSADEILATLDEDQSVDGLPFMPEMLQYCGRRFRVYRSAHKTADTIGNFAIRSMANSVHLEELRCDGASHGGCQAGCLLFWKECWLKRVPESAVRPHSDLANESAHGQGSRVVAETLSRGTTRSDESGRPERYRCQATEMLRATTEVRRRDRWNPLFYVRDLTSGNVSLLDFVRFGSLAMVNAFLLRWFGWRYPRLRGLAGRQTPTANLNLRPGELVRVLPKDEIMRTLNDRLRNRGLWFDVEMVPYCDNGTYRVMRRVDRIIDERTGEMINLPTPCVILDGVTCAGNYSFQRMFSRRHEYAYFREIWLKRVNDEAKAP